VTLDNIQSLACANGLSSFQGDMKYTSDKTSGNQCSVKIGLKKTLQNIFKGAKDYPTTEKVIQKGILECHYDFPADWKAYLNATTTSFAITTEIESRISRGLIKGSLCPKLDFKALNHFKTGGTIEIKKGLVEGGYTLEWKLKDNIPTGSRLFNTQATPAAATQISGKGLIKKPFVHTCTFNSKAIGADVTLTGTQQSE